MCMDRDMDIELANQLEWEGICERDAKNDTINRRHMQRNSEGIPVWICGSESGLKVLIPSNKIIIQFIIVRKIFAREVRHAHA